MSWSEETFEVFFNGLYQAMEKAIPASLGITFNTFDIMQVIAQREP